MNIIVASSAGFCFGVNRAYNLVQSEILANSPNSKPNIFTFGELIHNPRVIAKLEEQGVFNRLNNFPPLSKVVIRSHGISNKQKQWLKAQQVKIIDATCPFVAKIHTLSQNFQVQGFKVVVIGDQNHPEVQGIIEDLDEAICIKNEDEAENLTNFSALAVVVQTTFRLEKFMAICDILKQKTANIIINNTICSATINRQNEARLIAQKVDLMLVIGGKNSSNTKKLAEICQEYTTTFCLESPSDFSSAMLDNKQTIGITAGASTPITHIQEIQQLIKIWLNKKVIGH